MRYFIDFEFIEDFHKPLFGKKRHFIDMISIGIVCDDGREYYAVSNEFNIKDANEWVRKNVLEGINKELYSKESTYAKMHHSASLTLKNLLKWHGKSNSQIAEDVCMFCYPEQAQDFKNDQKEFLGRASQYGWNGEQPEFYGYYADYDWVLFCSLFGRMIDLPKGFPMYCRDLKQMLDEAFMYQETRHPNETRLESWLKTVKNHPEYPANKEEHNALADAKWNYDLYQFLVQKKFLNKEHPQAMNAIPKLNTQ
jgi:hypothetical protein